jgi:probable rRNA maturation factor
MMDVDFTLQIENLDHHPDFQSTTADGNPAIANITSVQWQSWFETWLQELDPQRSSINAYELNLLLTDDAEICSLNATYRQQDKATDVLAFAALEWDVPPLNNANLPVSLGDIVISVETAVQQAIAASHSLKLELIWLAAHGFLHLLGWDHPDRAHLEAMLLQQSQLLQVIGQESPVWSLDQWDYET